MSISSRMGVRSRRRVPNAILAEWSLWEQSRDDQVYHDFANKHWIQTERLDFMVDLEQMRPGTVSMRGEWDLRADMGFPT